MGLLMTMLLGLAGSFVGFLIFAELLDIGDEDAFDLGGLMGAIIGAMLLLFLYERFAGGRLRRRTRRPHGAQELPSTRPTGMSAEPSASAAGSSVEFATGLIEDLAGRSVRADPARLGRSKPPSWCATHLP